MKRLYTNLCTFLLIVSCTYMQVIGASLSSIEGRYWDSLPPIRELYRNNEVFRDYFDQIDEQHSPRRTLSKFQTLLSALFASADSKDLDPLITVLESYVQSDIENNPEGEENVSYLTQQILTEFLDNLLIKGGGKEVASGSLLPGSRKFAHKIYDYYVDNLDSISDILIKLIESYRPLLERDEEYIQSMLQKASNNKNLAAIKNLLKAGADHHGLGLAKYYDQHGKFAVERISALARELQYLNQAGMIMAQELAQSGAPKLSQTELDLLDQGAQNYYNNTILPIIEARSAETSESLQKYITRDPANITADFIYDE